MCPKWGRTQMRESKARKVWSRKIHPSLPSLHRTPKHIVQTWCPECPKRGRTQNVSCSTALQSVGVGSPPCFRRRLSVTACCVRVSCSTTLQSVGVRSPPCFRRRLSVTVCCVRVSCSTALQSVGMLQMPETYFMTRKLF